MSFGEDTTHASLIGQINEELEKGVRRVPIDGEGPQGLPEPHVRPDDKAQWDEVHGLWMDWDEQAQKWVPSPVQTASPTAAATAAPEAAADAAPSEEPPAEP